MTRARGGATPAARRPPGGRTILGPGLDFLLFIGTPVIIIPAVLLAHQAWSSAQIYLFVASFGAVGHHLPGMMRAYGDRSLFARFRARFVLAPILLVVACVFLAFEAKAALILAVFAWGAWHGAMQIHGFARIYDAKVGSTGRLTATLDRLLALTWFGTVLALSDTRTHFILDHALQAGLPAPPAGVLGAVRAGLVALAIALTIAWIANAARNARAGQPPSILKVTLLVTSIAFFAYANVVIEDLLLAVVLFEAFHDVQYLSIVWLFNRKRAQADPGAGALVRGLFRPRVALVGLYVALCFAYGGLNWVQQGLPQETTATVLAGVLAASAFLHFYYDGFIWRLREAGTRAGLGLAATPGTAPARARALPALAHAGAWVVLFAAPLGALAVTTTRAPDAAARSLALAQALPADAGAQRNRAVALESAGDATGALDAARRASALAAGSRTDAATRAMIQSTHASLAMRLAIAEARDGRVPAAAELAREAGALDPRAPDTMSEEAAVALERGDARAAESLGRALVLAAPDHGVGHYNLAAALAAQGRLPEALPHALRAAELLPGPATATLVSRLEAALR